MLKKHNIFLFIILILLICFCLFNKSLMENLENNENNENNKNDCSGKITCILKNRASKAHCNTQTAKQTAEKNNCGLGISASDLPRITNSIETKTAQQKS